jgi:uncharacterized protein involved in exopolysaccharide biosynthesis
LRDWLGLEEREELSEAEIRMAQEEQVAAALAVERVEDSRIIRVTYTADTPDRAAEIANTYAAAYVESLADRSRRTMERRAEFLQSRVAAVEQLAASAYREARQIRSQEDREPGGFEDLDASTARLMEARSEVEAAESTISARLSLMEDTDDLEALKVAAFQAEGGSDLVAAFEQASGQLEQLRQRGAAAYLVAQLEDSVENLRRELDQLLGRTRISLEQELEVLFARRASINRDLERALSPTSRRNWSEKLIAEHQAGVLQNIYADHLRELEIVYGRSGEVPISVIARARPSIEPSWPSYKLVLMLAVVTGLVVGGAIAMLREWYASGRVARPAQSERAAQ